MNTLSAAITAAALSLLSGIPAAFAAEASVAEKGRHVNLLSRTATPPPPCFTCHAHPRGRRSLTDVSPRQTAPSRCATAKSSPRYIPNSPIAEVPHAE